MGWNYLTGEEPRNSQEELHPLSLHLEGPHVGLLTGVRRVHRVRDFDE